MLRGIKSLAIAALAVAAIGGGAVASANGVSGPAFYVDGELYRTVGTPTDLSNTGAPLHSFDTIYAFDKDEEQAHNVATAAPGDEGFNGGRWMVIPVLFNDYDAALAVYDANGSGDFDSDEEIHAAVDGGVASFGDVVATFECPVIPVPRNG